MNLAPFARLGFALAFALPLAAMADVDPAAKAVLESSATAIKSQQHIRYDVLKRGEGGLGAMAPILTAKVHLERVAAAADAKPTLKWRVEGKSEHAMEKGPTLYVAVSDGTRTTWIDRKAKALVERFNATAGGETLSLCKDAWLSDLASDTPMAKSLAAPTITMLPPAEIDGVRVDVVEVIEADKNKSRWMIAQTDKLPRKYMEFFQGFPDTDCTSWVLSNMTLGEPAPAGTFALSAPEGFATSKAEDGVPKAVPMPASPAAPEPAPTSPPAPREKAIGFNIGDLAPDFELAQPSGDKIKLSNLRGNTVVVDFWGTWCLPCKKAAPELQKIHDARKDQKFRLLALAVREKDDAAPTSYMKEKGYTYTLLLQGDPVAKAYGVKAYPTYVVVNPEGVITARLESIEDLSNKLNTAIDAAMTPAAK